MESAQDLIYALIIFGLLFLLFALLAWKFWRGKWLHLIAGNNYIPESEKGSPAQLRLGKRGAIILVVSSLCMVTWILEPFGEAFGLGTLVTLGRILSLISIVVFIGSIVWLFVAQARDNKRTYPERPGADAKLDRRATIVLVCILLVYLGCIAFAVSYSEFLS